MLRLGLVVGLAAGIVDVAMAILQRPRDLEHLTALGPPILTVAAVSLAAYLMLWGVARRFAGRAGLQRRSAAVALGTLVLTGLTLAVLAGVHADSWSPHALFRSAVVLAVAAATSVGMYAAHEALLARRDLHERCVSLAHAAPLLLYQGLVYVWLVVYAIEDVMSFATAAATVALMAAVGLTAAFYVWRRGTMPAVGVLAVFALMLAVMPLVPASYSAYWAAAPASAAQSPRSPKQIVLITVDSLRADAVSAYAPEAARTGAIDQLARDGVVFERAMSTAPWTLPAVASMMTGLSPSVHLVSSVRSVLSDRVTTLAESLREHGYHTAAIVHNPLLDPDRNFAQGFDEYVDLRPPSFGDSVGARVLQTVWPGAYPPSAPSTQGHAARTVEWLEANRDRSFFLWVHFFDPHAPYEPDRTYMTADPPAGLGFRFDEDKLLATGVLLPPPDARQWIRSLYQAEVRGVDAAISGVIAALERMKLYDGSLIVLTSDHGEEFWDHGGQGHGHTLFDELLRVPLVVKLPGSSHRGRVATTVSTASVMPTVLDLSGIRYDRDSLTASSLAPLLTPGGEWSEDPHVVSTVVWATGALADSQEAVHFGQLKAIVRRSDGLATLYDTAIDPAERHSLAASNPDRLETGRQLLERHGEEAAALRRRLRVEEGSLTLDDNTLRQLRSLGYVQ